MSNPVVAGPLPETKKLVELPPPLVDGERAELPPRIAAFIAACGGRVEASPHLVLTPDLDPLYALAPASEHLLVVLPRLNDVRWINRFLQASWRALVPGGTLVVRFEDLRQHRLRLARRVPSALALPLLGWAFVVHRVLPKLRLTRRLYFAVTRGRNRPLSQAEVLGRLVYCGFEIEGRRNIGGSLQVVARKAGQPRNDAHPSYGPVFAMRRMGENGRPIQVFKLRTMHPYSEYIQSYVYERNRLADGGKLRNDFRVTRWGRLFRRLWLDELPMLLNWFRGDLKLVGVRPLSAHYESLYPAELRERRRQFRPGLIPPFYADLPRTFDEILASEERYLSAYQRAPFRTDVRYFARALHNIVLRRARSG